MRIFFDHQVTSLQDAGGVSRYHFELVRELGRRTDARVEYLLGWNASVLPFRELASPTVRVLSRTTSLRPGIARYGLNALLTNAVAPLRGCFDIYHSTYQRWEPGVRYRRMVATHHDSTPERFPELFPDAAAVIERKRRLYQRADAILCVSQASRADLLHYYEVDPGKVEVVYHGFRPLESAGEDRHPLQGTPYLLYVGSRATYKNFEALLRAMASGAVPESMALLVAGGGHWLPKELERLQALGLERRVTLLPRVEETELANMYRHASLLVYPSLYEGFGFPPLEAMSLGCPVLVSRTSSLPEICGGAAFYFDPGDHAALVDCLASLLADERVRRSRVELGRAQVERYTWKSAADATFALYCRCLGRADG
ncbi:MAG: glycosyltransferase family 4 protein [Acidobacteriaceae bacterium]